MRSSRTSFYTMRYFVASRSLLILVAGVGSGVLSTTTCLVRAQQQQPSSPPHTSAASSGATAATTALKPPPMATTSASHEISSEALLTPATPTNAAASQTPVAPLSDRSVPTKESALATLRRMAGPVASSLQSLRSAINRNGFLTNMQQKLADRSDSLRISVPVATGVGCILALNSGYLNGCCLSGLLLGPNVYDKPQGVAAVTGAFTTSALAVVAKNRNLVAQSMFRSQLGVIASYLGGSCLAGLLNPNPVPFHLSTSTAPTLGLGAALVYMAASRCNGVGDGSSVCRPLDVFYLLAAANGLQNSLTSVHMANVVRTAHFSGSASDTGTFLGQALRGNRQNVHRIAVNMALMTSFWLGGVVAAYSMTTGSSTTAAAGLMSNLVWSARLYLTLAAIVLALQFL